MKRRRFVALMLVTIPGCGLIPSTYDQSLAFFRQDNGREPTELEKEGLKKMAYTTDHGGSAFGWQAAWFTR